MTPGLNLSRYERPLAERRLLDGAVRDRWEPADRLPSSLSPVRRSRRRPALLVVRRPRPYVACFVLASCDAYLVLTSYDVVRGAPAATLRENSAAPCSPWGVSRTRWCGDCLVRRCARKLPCGALVRYGIMETSLVETRVSDVTRGTTTASRRRRETGVEGASQGFGQGPAPRFASAPRMSVMFFLLERDAGRESGRSLRQTP